MAVNKNTLGEEGNQNRFYHLYKEELRNETDTLNQRVIWSIFAQAGLLAAYVAVLNAPEKARDVHFASQQEVAIWILPIASFLLAFFTLPVIWASMVYMREMREAFKTNQGVTPEGFPPLMGRPKGEALTKLAEFIPLIIPAIIVVAWLGLFVGQVWIWVR